MIPGNPDLRKALENGPMTRDELVRHFQCSRSEVAKPIYSLIRSGEVLEEGDRVMLASQPRKAPESMGSTTPSQKIDSSPVSGPAMGMSEVEPRSPEQAAVDHPTRDAVSDDRDQRLRDALELLITELPELLADREKLRKLREVLG